MKTNFKLISKVLFIIAIAISSVSFAQNQTFNFQGVARNSDGKAISNETINVRFSIYPDGGGATWTEDQNIPTDGFGVFSTTIGSVQSSTFDAIDFSGDIYRLKVEIDIEGTWKAVSDEVLKSVPYARSAETAQLAQSAVNGVPPGCIMPFAGRVANIPSGWALCNGAAMNKTTYANLFAAIGSTWGVLGDNFYLPDFRGSFLRGADQGRSLDPNVSTRTANGYSEKNEAGSYQGHEVQAHNHSSTGSFSGGSTNADGGHFHHTVANSDQSSDDGPGTDNLIAKIRNDDVSEYDYIMWFCDNKDKTPIGGTSHEPDHSHTVTGNVSVSVTNTGGSENRPINYSVNYIIKL